MAIKKSRMQVDLYPRPRNGPPSLVVNELLVYLLDNEDLLSPGLKSLVHILTNGQYAKTVQIPQCSPTEAFHLASILLILRDVHTLKIQQIVESVRDDNQKLGFYGAELLSGGLRGLRNLQELTIWGQDIGPEGMCMVAGAISQCCSLESLSLGNNGIGGKGMKALAAVFPKLQRLQVLNLYNNDLREEGTSYVAASFPTIRNLRVLDLGSNHMGPKGLRHLAETICCLERLEVICIGTLMNEISKSEEDRVKAICTRCRKRCGQVTANCNWFSRRVTLAACLRVRQLKLM